MGCGDLIFEKAGTRMVDVNNSTSNVFFQLDKLGWLPGVFIAIAVVVTFTAALTFYFVFLSTPENTSNSSYSEEEKDNILLQHQGNKAAYISPLWAPVIQLERVVINRALKLSSEDD